MPELADATVEIGNPGLNGGGVTTTELTAAVAGLAPSNATYIVQTANGTLTAEQALSSLSTGLLKVTTGTGVLSTATGSDVPAHTHTGIVFGMPFLLDGGGVAITTGTKFESGVPVPVACSIYGYHVSNNAATSIATTVQRRPAGSTTWTTISGSEGPTCNLAEFASDTNITTWTVTSFSAFDQFRIVVSSATSTYATITLLFTRSI